MRINEMNLDNNLLALLTELFSMKGAKEIFAKHNIEMVTEQIEKEGLRNFIKQAKEIYETSKTVEEYKQAISFLDLQINANKNALEQANGFMKNMIEGMIKGFESTKQLAVTNFSPMFAKELKELLHNIVNEKDKKQVEAYIEKYNITNLNEMLELVKSIDLSINSRYSEIERKVDENILNDTKENKQIEVELNDLSDEQDTKKNETVEKEKIKKTKKKEHIEKAEEKEQIDTNNIELDFLENDYKDDEPIDTSSSEDDLIDEEDLNDFLELEDDNTDDGVDLDF